MTRRMNVCSFFLVLGILCLGGLFFLVNAPFTGEFYIPGIPYMSFILVFLILFPLFIALLLSNISIACLKKKFPSIQGGGTVALYFAIAFPIALFFYLMTYSCTVFNSSYTYEKSPDEKYAVHAIGVSNTLFTPGIFRYLVRNLETREIMHKGAYVFSDPIDMKMFDCKVNWNDDGSIALLLITALPEAIIPGTRYWSDRSSWSAATNTIEISATELKGQ